MESVIFQFFFFQAEDGIRDFCLSRGLGDVYKRQILEFVQESKEQGKQGNIFKSEELRQRVPFRTVESLRDRYKRYLSHLTEGDVQNLRNLLKEKGPDVYVHFVKSDEDATRKEIKSVSENQPQGPRYRTIREKVTIEAETVNTRGTRGEEELQPVKRRIKKPKQKIHQYEAELDDDIENIETEDQITAVFPEYRESIGSRRRTLQNSMEIEQDHFRESFGRQQQQQQQQQQQRAPNQVQPQYQIPKSDNNPFTLPQQQSVEFKRNKPQVEEDSDSDDEIDFQKYAAKGADLENEDSEYDEND
eukprot:TRINITY_DN327_c0_g1_i11.p1 TRINITY_DN327_c0_g1~~TRINITY_DN327_c0_g1_i11.p1  ORF type:complete len:303 (+),score=89.22 TRINITY_DN327_c0_g1_i11:28-936(+)